MGMSEPPRSSTVHLRRARPADAHALAAVFDAAVRDAWTYLGAVVQQPLFTADHWNQLVADHAAPKALLLAETDDGVLGFAAVHPEDGELFLLFVHPDHAGRGFGGRLLDAAHAEIRAGGRRQAYLYTHELNARAIAVYRRAGYRPDGTDRTTEFRGIPLRELRLTKDL